nr:MAG TPA: hypothetical protein [Caudoviricetes sp.]
MCLVLLIRRFRLRAVNISLLYVCHAYLYFSSRILL